MSDADQLLKTVRKAAAIVARDWAGRVVIQLTLDEADADRLMAHGADAGERDGTGDDGRYREPAVSVGWLEST